MGISHQNCSVTWRTYLVSGPTFEAVRVELVDMENVDGALDAEVVQLTRHFQE